MKSWESQGKAWVAWIVLLLMIIVAVLQWPSVHFADDSSSVETEQLSTPEEAQTYSLPVELADKTIDRQSELLELDKDDEVDSLLSDCEAPQQEVELASEARIDDFLSKLKDSTQQDDQYYYALYGGEPRQRLTSLQNYQRNYPGNPQVMREWLRLCGIEAPVEYCDKSLIAESLDGIPDDGTIWLNLAAYQARNGNDEDVIHALQRLNRTSHFGSPFAESISDFLNMTQQAEGEVTHSAIISALGKEAAKSSAIVAIFDWCKKHNQELAAVDLCFQTGKTLAIQSKELSNVFFGINLQQMVADTNHDYQFQPVDDRVWKKIKSEGVLDNFLRISPFMNSNEDLVLEWLENFKQHGEVEAAKRATQEILDMAHGQPHLLCKQNNQ